MTLSREPIGRASLTGTVVRLDRDIDRARPCHENLAVIVTGTELHAAGLRCSSCNAHRGWLSHEALALITKTLVRFGAPNEPIIVRQQRKEAPVAFEQRPNSGALFRTKRKERI